MDKRSILIGLGVLTAGVLLGGLLVWIARPDSPPSAPAAGESIERTAVTEPIPIGNPNPPEIAAVPELTSLNRLFKGVAERVTPTVVFIEVEVPAERRARQQDREFEEWHPFRQRRQFRRSAGSGVIVSPRGYVVTNAHVIDGATRIRVLLNDKREYDAEVVGEDPTTDLAVIRMLDTDDLPVASLGNSDDLEVGEWVLAVGNPFRLTSTVTAGIVSALGRQVDIIEDDFRIEDFIQTDAAINPGNSGGALVNLRGEVVGVATAIATESGSYEGYGFAVPMNLVTRVATDLIANGEVARGYLGVEIRAVTAADADRLDLGRIGGVLVSNVAQGGAAQTAGLRSGDVLLAIDGREIDAPNQFQSAIALRRPADNVRLTVWRRGERRDFDARLLGRDDDALRQWVAEVSGRNAPPVLPDPATREPFHGGAGVTVLEAWGLGLRDLTDEERDDYKTDDGVYVASVRQGGTASADGMPSQVVVTEIEGEPVASVEEAVSILERIASDGGTALVEVQRLDGVTAFYDLESLAYQD